MAVAFVTGTKNVNGTDEQFFAIGTVQGDGYCYFNDDDFYRCYQDGSMLQIFYERFSRWVITNVIQNISVSGFNVSGVTGGGGSVAPDGTVEAMVKWAEGIASDPSHGYDQTNRNGPDYDCSSLVMWAMHEGMGIPLFPAYNVGGLWQYAPQYGWVQHSGMGNNVSELVRGDVLIALGYHCAIYAGQQQVVQATSNELNRATGGQTGDQTGEEICVGPYYSFPWTGILRYGS